MFYFTLKFQEIYHQNKELVEIISICYISTFLSYSKIEDNHDFNPQMIILKRYYLIIQLKEMQIKIHNFTTISFHDSRS